MADEPRRSGRATKGQHTKDREAPEDPATKKSSRGKSTKAKAAEQEVEKDEVIRCVCGTYEEEEDVPRAMICCDNCSAWQHNGCMGLPEDYTPDSYFCEQCKPDNHKDLVAAMARGEKPWEESLRQVAEAKKGKKKGGRRGRKPGGPRASEGESQPDGDAVSTPQVPATGQKRKLEEASDTPEYKNKKARTPTAEPNGSETTAPGELAVPQDSPSKQTPRSGGVAGVVKDVKELTNTARKGAATSLIKMVESQIKEALKRSEYTLPAGSTAAVVASQTGVELEHFLYHVQSGGSGDPGDEYKNQLRAITFNVKKNHALGVQLLNGELSAQGLAAMDPKDMASDEQKEKDAAVMNKMEKQHTIIEEQGPRIRRTHKGDEYIDESKQVAAESQTSHAPVRKPSSAEADIDIKQPLTKSPPADPALATGGAVQAKSKQATSTARRQSSANFDIDKVWSNVQGSPDADGQRFGELPPGSPGRTVREPKAPGATADADIDELLKDEEAESPPYSPKETTEPDGTVWRGVINGGNLGRFHATAKYAAGATPDSETLRMTYEQVIPAEIAVGGRIQPVRADEYLCGLEYSHTSDLVIVYIAEPPDALDQEQFEKLFRYFKNKDRFGVGIQHANPAIKDIYLIPLELGQEMPTFVKKIETDFPDTARERMFLVPIVIKNSELPHNMAAAMLDGTTSIASPSARGSVAQTPITPHEGHLDSQQSTAYGQHPTVIQHGMNGAPYQAPLPPAMPQTYPVSQYPPPQQQQSPPLSLASQNAQRVLGPLASSPAVVQLCAQVPTAGENEFKVIKECLERNPEAANSLEVLTNMLQHVHSGQGTGT